MKREQVKKKKSGFIQHLSKVEVQMGHIMYYLFYAIISALFLI